MYDPDFRKMAEKYGWEFIEKNSHGMVSYRKMLNGYPARINIYMTTMTVSTAINHPNKGKTQLFRRNVNHRLLKQIFINPRIHTGMGYHKR